MGKASRARQKRRSTGQPKSGPRESDSIPETPRDTESGAEAALLRLVAGNHGPRHSVASAYAWGVAALHWAQQDRYPEWHDQLDPLDLILLGLVHPKKFADSFEFGNARTAWLRELRTTPHWQSVSRFVSEAVSLSNETGYAVDDSRVLLELNARLESAGLAHRRLPKALHPGILLANARFVEGLNTDSPVPPATNDSRRRAEDLLSNLEPGFPQDDSCAEMLRDGLCLLSRAGMPPDFDSNLLTIALYVALTDSNDAPMDEIPERAHAWALGLGEKSSLIPVVDTISACAAQDLPTVTTLSHLFVLPEFTQRVDQEDRRWHSEPGTDLVPLALELGHDRVSTRASRAFRLSPSSSAILGSVLKDDSPEASNASEMPGDEVVFDGFATIFDLIGLHPAWAKAFLDENAPLPRLDGTFNDKAGERDWHAAIERYLREHPDAAAPDVSQELDKLRRYDGIMVIKQALADVTFARQLVDLITHDPMGEDDGLIGVRALVEGIERPAADLLNEDSDFEERTLQLALDWGGTALRDRVVGYGADDEEDEAVLLVLAGAYLQQVNSEARD
ncbi:hypothetical protein [Amycolatopsis sp. cg9]|uniref:hypothetical protein n=1 Tax=Amycolatopsis sp. cg9 TaxID=3238801 RepID=UPI003523D1E4